MHQRHVTCVLISTPTTSPSHGQHSDTVNSQHAENCVHQCEGANKFTLTEMMHSVNASLLMDVSVNFGPISSRSLQCRDVAARAKGVPHRCMTNGHASSCGPNQCDKHAWHSQAWSSQGWCSQGACKVAQFLERQHYFPTTTSFNQVEASVIFIRSSCTPRSASITVVRTFCSVSSVERAEMA